ncbi:VOC family protein [Jatrophihabitans sp. YIM 134969]
MTHRSSPWPHGAPCWVTLATADEQRARAFYGEVLGWDFQDVGPRQHDWTLAEVDGRVVAGIGAIREDATSSWLLSFAVDDVDAAAAAVVNGNGQVLQPPHDVLAGAGRAAVARDPGGLRFGMLQAGEFAGVDLVNRPGAVVWEDGGSDDPEASRAFAATVLGWSYTAEPRVGADYAMFGPAGDPQPWGGLGARSGDEPAEWTVWFGVESVDGAVDVVIGRGGGVLSGPDDTPWGRLARVQDPDGATFGLLAPDWDALPQR